MDLKKEKTALNSSIGVDEGQSIHNTSIITGLADKNKPFQEKKSEKSTKKEVGRFQSMTLTQLYEQNFPPQEATTDNLHLAVACEALGSGLEKQLLYFMEENPKTKLLVIDTMQLIREQISESASYSADYGFIRQVKSFADTHNLCVMIVHHTRK